MNQELRRIKVNELHNELIVIRDWLHRHPYIDDNRNPDKHANNAQRQQKHQRRAAIWRELENIYKNNVDAQSE